MNAAIALVLVFAAVVNGGIYTATSQIHGVTLQQPTVLHSAPVLAAPAILHTSSSSTYKYRAPAAKIALTPVVHHAPTLVATHHAPALVATHHAVPVVHTMSHGVLLH